VDVVAEYGRSNALEFEDDILGLQAPVTLGAVAGRSEDVLAVVTCTTGLAVGHVGHGGFTDDRLVGEELGVAVLAAVGGGMYAMAERGRPDPLEVEHDFLRLDDTLMAALAIGRNAEDHFAVVASTAGHALFHLVHADRFTFAGDDLAVMAALAGAAGFGDMNGVAENRTVEAADLVGDVPGFSLVAADAILLGGDAEGPHAGMTGSARFCLFHLSHGGAPAVFEVEDSVVADLAVVVVLPEVKLMAEDYRVRVFEGKLDILGFRCQGTDSTEDHNCTG